MERQKKFVGLSDAERSEIAILLQRDCSLREIARALGRSPNTVSYEVRKQSVGGIYDPLKAKQKSRIARHSRRYHWQKIERYPALRSFVIERLAPPYDWSPRSISGYLRCQQTELPYISTMQIYAWLYRSCGQPYCQYLSSRRYRPKRHTATVPERTMIPERTGIAQRPKGATNRTRYGHWEGDTVLSGKKTGSKTALVVTVERKTRLIAATLIPNLRPESFAVAAAGLLAHKKALSLTLDNGIENKRHADITVATGACTFFCDPYSSWQKGSVEHANKLFRRYLPKGGDLSTVDQAFVDEVVARLNNKPRKILGYKSALQLAYEKGVI